MYPTSATLRTVGSFRRFLPLVCGLAFVPGSARAAVLIHEYALQGTLSDSQGGPALTALGGEITALGYVFTPNQGLSFSSTSFNASSFSLEFSFSLDSPAGMNKLVDFHQQSTDAGLYQNNGVLMLFPAAAGSAADAAGNVHVVLTRDGATNEVVGYVNGQQRFSFIDTTSLTVVPNSTASLFFFYDDTVSRQEEASGGVANYLRVFNGALTSTEVSTLFAAGPPMAIPEPPAAVLLALGGIAVGVWTVRRKKSR